MIRASLIVLLLPAFGSAATFRTEANGAVATSSSSATVPSGSVPVPLPSGPGLAAKYPGDKGIAADPAVLFADGFEAVDGDRLTTGVASDDRKGWNHPWDMAWGPLPVSKGKGRANSGKRALDLATPSGPQPTGAGISKFLPVKQRVVFYRYYTYYDKTFPGGHHVGGAIEARAPGVPHANPGVYPDGKNKITVLLDHWTLEPGIASPGPQVAYIYHLDQVHQWGEQFYPSGKIQPGTNMHNKLMGDAFVPRPDFTPAKGKWICQELMVDAGTPGGRDGRVAFWADGELKADFVNLRFRTDPELLLGRIDLGCYESRDNGVHKVRFDDVVVATAYIGPMTTGK